MYNKDDNSVARAFVVRPEASGVRQEGKALVREEVSPFGGRGKGMFRGRVNSRGRKRSFSQRQIAGDYKPHKARIQCHNYKRYGHVQTNYWFKNCGAKLTEEQGTSNLFMVK